MKVIRFSGWWAYGWRRQSYGYIKANWFERRAIRKRIAAGDTGIRESQASGPRGWGAQFIITAKRKEHEPR